MMNPVSMMEVKKTILFTFFKAPKRHVNNIADKQENVSKREVTHLLSAAMSCLFMASTFYDDFF